MAVGAAGGAFLCLMGMPVVSWSRLHFGQFVHARCLKIGVSQTYGGGVSQTYGRGVTQTYLETVGGGLFVRLGGERRENRRSHGGQ